MIAYVDEKLRKLEIEYGNKQDDSEDNIIGDEFSVTLANLGVNK